MSQSFTVHVNALSFMLVRTVTAAKMIMSMKNSNDTIGNRTSDLPACSAVPQPTVPPHGPKVTITQYIFVAISCTEFYLNQTQM
jgi:hypothetical protein